MCPVRYRRRPESHRNIECNTRDIIEYLSLGPADRAMVVLPFHYCFGLSLLHTHLMAGGSVVLNNAFRLFPEQALLNAVARHRAVLLLRRIAELFI